MICAWWRETEMFSICVSLILYMPAIFQVYFHTLCNVQCCASLPHIFSFPASLYLLLYLSSNIYYADSILYYLYIYHQYNKYL